MIAPIEFRAKARAGVIKVPKLTRNHCDMHRFRNKSRKYGSYANSDLFPAMLSRGVAAMGIGSHIELDNLPEGVSVDTSSFLATVRIELPLD